MKLALKTHPTTYASSDDNTCERNQFTVFAPALFERRKKKQPILSHNRLTSLISSNPDVPAHIKFRMLRLSIQSRLEVYDAGHAFSLSLVLLRCVRTAVSVLTLFVPADAAPPSHPPLSVALQMPLSCGAYLRRISLIRNRSRRMICGGNDDDCLSPFGADNTKNHSMFSSRQRVFVLIALCWSATDCPAPTGTKWFLYKRNCDRWCALVIPC